MDQQMMMMMGLLFLAIQQNGLDLGSLLGNQNQLMTMAMAFMAFQVMNNQGSMNLGGLEGMFNMEQGNIGGTVMMMVAACMTLRMIQQ